jgi:hypothetical protein
MTPPPVESEEYETISKLSAYLGYIKIAVESIKFMYDVTPTNDQGLSGQRHEPTLRTPSACPLRFHTSMTVSNTGGSAVFAV